MFLFICMFLILAATKQYDSPTDDEDENEDEEDEDERGGREGVYLGNDIISPNSIENFGFSMEKDSLEYLENDNFDESSGFGSPMYMDEEEEDEEDFTFNGGSSLKYPLADSTEYNDEDDDDDDAEDDYRLPLAHGGNQLLPKEHGER